MNSRGVACTGLLQKHAEAIACTPLKTPLEDPNATYNQARRLAATAGTLAAIREIKRRCSNRRDRAPILLDRFTGLRKVEYWEYESPEACWNALGMEAPCFTLLWKELESLNLIEPTPHLPSKVQVAITLWMLRHNQRIRGMREIFQVSNRTLSLTIHSVLDAIFDPKFYYGYVKQPTSMASLDQSTYHYSSYKYSPLTERCLGAIDGTHIKINPPKLISAKFRSRKGDISTNVLAACTFKMEFTYVYPGWEGSQNDAAVYHAAILEDFKIPKGCYYLADAGYPLNNRLLTPFAKTRYHLQEWGKSGLRPATAPELFNRRHATLRNVVERIFGVVKKRFPVLVDGTSYPLDTQTQIIYVCCCLHNYCQAYGNDRLRLEEDIESERLREPTERTDRAETVEREPLLHSDRSSRAADTHRMGVELQKRVAAEMWEGYMLDLENRASLM